MIHGLMYGDLIQLAKDGEYEAIVHGCNCFCTMGAGIAKKIKQEFPVAYAVDQETIAGDKSKLGTYTFAHDPRYNVTVVNGYTQYYYRSKTSDVDYSAIQRVFAGMNEDPMFQGKAIGIPKIGAGLAGGDWEVIRKIINSVTPDLDIEVVAYKIYEL